MESAASAAETILKVDCEGDLRRALLKGTPSYAAIDRAVQEIWPNRSAHEAKYLDEEGDACSLTENTFPDFLCTAQNTANAQVLRLVLSPASAASNDDPTDPSKAPSAEEAFSMPWQHVEQGSDAGEEGLHTVADLTDIQEHIGSDQPVTHEVAKPAEAVNSVWDKSCENVGQSRGATTPQQISASASQPASQEAVHTASGYPIQGVAQEQVPRESLEDANRRCQDQTDIVIAAFDEDGDGYLSFREIHTLFKSSCDDPLPRQAYDQLCAEIGADVRLGLDRDALMCIYSCGNSWLNLERDFTAARRKLEGLRPKPMAKQAALNNPMSLVLKNPLLAAPFALDVAERVRQGVVSQMK